MNIIQAFQSLEECFGDLPDPRVVGRCDHPLVEIIMAETRIILEEGSFGQTLGSFCSFRTHYANQVLFLKTRITHHNNR